MVALARADITLIQGRLQRLYDGRLSPNLAKAYDETGNVILCSSLSKTLAPGLRIGWMVPGRRRQPIEMLKFINSLMTSELPQLAIAEFLASGGYDHHLRRLRRAFREQMEKTTLAIAKYFPEGTRVSRPQGGFLLWVELPKQVDSIVLMRDAAEENISIAPGPLFSTTDRYSISRVSVAAIRGRQISASDPPAGRDDADAARTETSLLQRHCSSAGSRGEGTNMRKP
jgi:DNA-binding transcriptional MocR family regulator